MKITLALIFVSVAIFPLASAHVRRRSLETIETEIGDFKVIPTAAEEALKQHYNTEDSLEGSFVVRDGKAYVKGKNITVPDSSSSTNTGCCLQ